MSQSSKEQIVAVNPIVHIQAVRENLKYYRSISKSTDSEQIKQAYITTYRAMNTAWNAFTDDPYLKTIRDLIIERKAKEIVVARPSLSPDPVEQSRYLSTSRELFSWYPDWTDGNPITQKDKSLARNNVMTNASRVLDVLEEALGIKPDLKLIDAGMLKHYAVQASFVPPDRQHEFYKSRAILQMAMTQGGTVVGVNSGIYNLESRSPVYFWHTSDDTKLSSVMKNLQVKEDGLGGVEVAYEPDEDITVTNLWAVSNDEFGTEVVDSTSNEVRIKPKHAVTGQHISIELTIKNPSQDQQKRIENGEEVAYNFYTNYKIVIFPKSQIPSGQVI